ncbi:MAG: ACT domain-containing protein [Promethearchaeota archaeon]
MVKQLTVFLPNKPGQLAAVTGLLAQNDVDIRALTVSETADFGLLRLIVNKPEKALEALREASFLVDSTEVLAIEMRDVPGGLHEIAKTLGDANVNIEYLYAFAHPGTGAVLLLAPNDVKKAVEVLDRANVRLFSAEEVYSL